MKLHDFYVTEGDVLRKRRNILSRKQDRVPSIRSRPTENHQTRNWHYKKANLLLVHGSELMYDGRLLIKEIAMLVHSVYFWLKDDLSDADRAVFRRGLESLTTIKSAHGVYVGTPAATPRRPIVESSYDFALTVILKDITAHDAYQVDPIHKAFVADCSAMWKKLTIFDAI